MSRAEPPALVYKIMCARTLALLRDRADLLQSEVAKQFGWSQPKVTQIETAVSGVQPDDLERLLDLYDASEPIRERCRELALRGKKQPPRRRTALRNRFDGAMRDVIDLERSAATTSRHNSMVIPGVLQTADYMHNLFRAYRPSL